jgi:hypothetical protein
MLSDRILEFYRQLEMSTRLPARVNVMNPYKDPYTLDLCRKFYEKYYQDDNSRVLMLGINPGRFGSGTTGISFTDPVKLEKICGIENIFPKKAELSADFIYMMINAFGGPKAFYSRFFISAVSPLGFTKNGKNINYYDDGKLEKAIKPFVIDSINRVMAMGMNQDRCFCIGGGENFLFLNKLNQEHGWWREIIPLAHPRFIMQYRRKKVTEYVEEYLNQLGASTQKTHTNTISRRLPR